MNYYYCTIEGASKEVNMEFLSNYLPDNISQLGFLCSECKTYMMDSHKRVKEATAFKRVEELALF